MSDHPYWKLPETIGWSPKGDSSVSVFELYHVKFWRGKSDREWKGGPQVTGRPKEILRLLYMFMHFDITDTQMASLGW